MLEETDNKSKELAVNISRDLDIDALMTTMKNLYDLYVRILEYKSNITYSKNIRIQQLI